MMTHPYDAYHWSELRIPLRRDNAGAMHYAFCAFKTLNAHLQNLVWDFLHIKVYDYQNSPPMTMIVR